jgi:hypothetical protein
MPETASGASATFSPPWWLKGTKSSSIQIAIPQQQYSHLNFSIPRRSNMWQYNPHNPNIPRWKPDPEPILVTFVLQNPEPTAGSSTKDPGAMLKDVERALNYIKTTLGELDRALSGVEQRLSGMEESLNSNQPMHNQQKISPALQAVRISTTQVKIDHVLVKEAAEDRQRLYDPEINPELLQDGPDTGSTLQWYLEQDNKVLVEIRDLRALRKVPKVGNKELIKELDSDFADDEKSPPLWKQFNN